MNITRYFLVRAAVILISTLVFMTLCGCVSRYTEVKQIGVMQLRTYWKGDNIRWEGNTWLEKEEMCPPSGVNCVTAKSLFYQEYNGLMWVAIDERNSPKSLPAMYFYNSKTGAQISCADCTDFVKHWAYNSGGSWLKDGRFIMFTSQLKEKENGLLVAHVNTAANTVTLRTVKQNSDEVIQSLYGESVSPDQTGFAWYECSPTCTLYWLNEDYTKILSEGTGCASGDFEVYWKKGTVGPLIGFSAGTSKFEKCRDVKGVLKYPQLPWGF
jgi:hypothetical protein